MYTTQRLESVRIYQFESERSVRALAWHNVAPVTRRRAKAEARARFARIDDANALLRIRRV